MTDSNQDDYTALEYVLLGLIQLRTSEVARVRLAELLSKDRSTCTSSLQTMCQSPAIHEYTRSSHLTEELIYKMKANRVLDVPTSSSQ